MEEYRFVINNLFYQLAERRRLKLLNDLNGNRSEF